MSTPITLAVGDIDLTYNTGHMGMDHGMLFQERDRRRRHASINYEYYEKHSKDVSKSELCFCRTLGSMVSRLERVEKRPVQSILRSRGVCWPV